MLNKTNLPLALLGGVASIALALPCQAGEIHNVALSSLGATAFDNGSFDDYGFDYDALLTIDGNPSYPSYWAGREYVHPQRVWIFFDQMYAIDELRILERSDAYMNTGSVEYLRNGQWLPLTSVSKSVHHFTHTFDAVMAEGVRVNVTTSTSPTNWYNNVACFYSVEVSGSIPIGVSMCGPAVVNSTGNSGALFAIGSDLAVDNDLTLLADGLPASEFGYVLASETPGFAQQPGGSQGNLCLGGNIARFVQQARFSSGNGTLSFTPDLTQVPTTIAHSVVSGESWSFQVWFRDAATSNFTDAVAIQFL